MPPGPLRPVRNAPAPPVKWVLRDRLLDELYNPVIDNRTTELADLIERNTALLIRDDQAMKVINPGHFHRSFAYNGKFYSTSADDGPPVRNRVHADLMREVKEHVEFYEGILQSERLLVSGYLDSVFSFSASPGDWIKLLPETIQPTLRANIVVTPETEATIWDPVRSSGAHEAFLAKRQKGFELIRQRLARNLISI